MKRIFLALRAQINDYNKLQSEFTDVIEGRWVPIENLHVTVCFFGDKYEVDELIKKMPPLNDEIEELELGELGYFKHNNILYAGLKSHKLKMLHSSICKTFSIPNTKRFIPHVTLMRIKKIEDEEAFKKILINYENKAIGKIETRFELMQSQIMHPGGAKYKSIHKY